MVCLERFHNAADFEFFIVGNIEIKILRPLLETYIASIPTNNKRVMCQNSTVPWLKDATDKDMLLSMEDSKSFGRIGYKKAMKYSLKTALIAKALGDILRLRFVEIVEQEQGGIYGVSASVKVSKRPIEQASIQVAFDCHPDQVERLVTMVHQEMENITKEGVSQTHLENITTNYLKERKGRYNSYDMGLLMNYFHEGFNLNDFKNFEDVVNTISIEDVQAFTKALLKDTKLYKVVFNPKG
jgi:zinc protease